MNPGPTNENSGEYDRARFWPEPKPSAIAMPRRRLGEPAVEKLVLEADALGLRVETVE